jgi:serine/threonine protein kinase
MRHALGPAARIELVIAVCQAVQHAHERGVIHRDLKPANVLVSDTGLPKVLDFGIARATGLDIHSTIRTAHGQLIGTLAYMSPERLHGGTEVDGRSDVYALGVMFYRLMAGRLPFDVVGLPLADAAQRILYTDVPPLGSIDAVFAGAIEHVAQRAMARDPDRRYQSAADLAADLRACLEGRLPTTVSVARAPSSAAAPLIVAESPDRRFVALSLLGGTVIVLDSTTGAPLTEVRGDGTAIVRLAFDADGGLLIGRAGGRVERVAVRAPS